MIMIRWREGARYSLVQQYGMLPFDGFWLVGRRRGRALLRSRLDFSSVFHVAHFVGYGDLHSEPTGRISHGAESPLSSPSLLSP
jgi:hypothetical protein